MIAYLAGRLLDKKISRQNVLDQWERNILVDDFGGDEAFVMTRRQKALQEAQLKADELIYGPEEGDLQMLFEGMVQEETGKKNPKSDTLLTEPSKR